MNDIKCNCTAYLEGKEVPPERHDRTCPVYQAHAYIGIDIAAGESKTRIYINGKTFVPIEELDALQTQAAQDETEVDGYAQVMKQRDELRAACEKFSKAHYYASTNNELDDFARVDPQDWGEFDLAWQDKK